MKDTAPAARRAAPTLAPGVAFTLVGAAFAFAAAGILPGVSALLVAIGAGALWRNLLPVPETVAPGVDFSARHLLRAGIVLLGFQVPVAALVELGFGALGLAVAALAVTYAVTLFAGARLRVGYEQRVLIASGFSICGAAAVAATQDVVRGRREEVATALALVVAYGTLMIPLVPFLGDLLGLGEEELGVWIGAATHEVAQVVAAGGSVGATALAAAVAVKLTRVVLLAPVIAGVSAASRRRGGGAGGPGDRRAPHVPAFILGFLLALAVRATGVLPTEALDAFQAAQSVLLSAAMFALGLGIDVRALARVGLRPVLLGAIATVTILVVSLAGVLLTRG